MSEERIMDEIQKELLRVLGSNAHSGLSAFRVLAIPSPSEALLFLRSVPSETNLDLLESLAADFMATRWHNSE